MGNARLHGHLASRIGRRVRYGAPKDVHKKGGKARRGVVVDEIWTDTAINVSPPRKPRRPHDWGDYSFCAQLIKWDEDDGYSIRLGYWRRRCGEDWWEFAGQTTVSSKWPAIKALCEKTLSKTAWFHERPKLRFPRLKE